MWQSTAHPPSDPDGTGSRTSLGRLWEVIQLEGSPKESTGQADFLLLELGRAEERHPFYDMPCVIPTNSYTLVPLTQVCCAVNVQHDCYDGKCGISLTRVIWQERETTQQRAFEVRHAKTNKYVLNTAQMHDAASVAPFYLPLVFSEPREDIIHRAAIREINLQAAKQLAQSERRPTLRPALVQPFRRPQHLVHHRPGQSSAASTMETRQR
ncbi:hypothetical protein NUW54_g6201 [Trametes sanguinea]|uniref:Uncharacterized protein n=1 Tax=Trametes sanguinea TaxID=158606 RepID=A0ACC1PTZ0_9APHY|nr:hypothetical protein NUW54_g6201 [Trametes sanguinea]